MERDSDSDSDSSFILSGNPSTPSFPLLLGENNPTNTTTTTTNTACDHLPQTPFLSTRTPFTQLSLEPADFLSTDSPKRLRFDCKPPTIPQSSELARLRRQTMSAKTRALQKLMPGDARMDTVTTLEEARKYVQFLQAQIKVLQSMPCVDHQMVSSSSRYGTFNNSDDPNLITSKLNIDKSAFGDHQLWMLNRQQLVEVMLNSAVGQTWLYSQGCCVFSLEQVAALKEAVERKAALKMVFDRTTARVI